MADASASSQGQLIVVQEKKALMKQLGKKQMTVELEHPLAALPAELAEWNLVLKARRPHAAARVPGRRRLRAWRRCCAAWASWALVNTDVNTRQSSLEDIFVSLA